MWQQKWTENAAPAAVACGNHSALVMADLCCRGSLVVARTNSEAIISAPASYSAAITR